MGEWVMPIGLIATLAGGKADVKPFIEADVKLLASSRKPPIVGTPTVDIGCKRGSSKYGGRAPRIVLSRSELVVVGKRH